MTFGRINLGYFMTKSIDLEGRLETEEKSSAISGFYKLSVDDRIEAAAKFAGLDSNEKTLLRTGGGLTVDHADKMIENVITVISIPVGLATNFRVNGKDYLVPMALEEPSVVAGASNAAKIARKHGGFRTSYSGSVMEGHVQLENIPNLRAAVKNIREHKDELLRIANEKSNHAIAKDVGADVVRAKTQDGKTRHMIAANILIDCKDAMGANVINKMAEAIAPKLVELTGGTANVRILSNYSERRLATASAVFDKDELGGESMVKRMLSAYEFADSYLKRAVTHNKGIMNGVTPVALALMQDTRAIEAGIHAYATSRGGYRSLTSYSISEEGHLVGTCTLPIAVGTVGGSLEVHPISQALLKIMGINPANPGSAGELAQVMAATGLAQNVAALKSLAGNGIIEAHMSLHNRKKMLRTE